MFWILFVIVLIIGCSLAWLVDFFQQMKNSEYEIVRVAYWGLVTAFWITFLVWIWSW
jgi:formate-dependent nitrite reductase membrane component NrfD